MLLAENNNVNDPCRFQLNATMIGTENVTKLGKIIFSFGFSIDGSANNYFARIEVENRDASYVVEHVSYMWQYNNTELNVRKGKYIVMQIIGLLRN